MLYIFLHLKLFRCFFQYLSKKQTLSFLLIFLLIVLSFGIPFLYETGDYSYLLTATFILRKFIIYTFLLMVIWKKYREKSSVDHFIYYFSIATALYVLSTLLLVMIPSLRSFWLDVTTSEFEKGLLDSYGYTMRVGWQGYSGFRCTFRCTLSVIFLMYLLLTKSSCLHIKKRRLFLLLIFTFAGNTFYGRSGLMISLITVVIALIMSGSIGVKYTIHFTFIAAIGLILVYILGNTSTGLHDWYIWMSTPFKNLFTTGSFNNYSVNNLVDNMLFMPDVNTIIFGDGYYTDPLTKSYYMQTDSGLMRQILFWGLMGMTVSYGCIIVFLSNFKRKYRILGFALLLSIIIFEIKGEVYYEFLPLLFILVQLFKIETDCGELVEKQNQYL